MKKAKIILSIVTLSSLASVALALKAVNKSFLVYYTTTVRDAICTATLTHAITTNDPAAPAKYYTFSDNQKCSILNRVTKAAF